MRKQNFVFTVMLLSLLILPSGAYAEHVFKDVEAFAQYLDITQLESEKITLQFDDKSYDLYYGYHGSLDSIGSDDLFPTLSSMNINEERKSLEIVMYEVPENTDFWIRIPEDVLYAEGGEFLVLVDDKDTRYDVMEIYDDQVIGFFITENTENIEIIGTGVIPEFGSFAIFILILSISGLVYFTKKIGFNTNRIGTIK